MPDWTEKSLAELLTPEQLRQILAAIADIRVVLIGDLGLDAYWKADLTRSELSRETPHFPLPIIEERYAPGASGNVAANLAALMPRTIRVIGTAGPDWRWEVLRQELSCRGIDCAGVAVYPGRVTNAYVKPYRRGLSAVEYEDPRLDFTNYTPQPAELDALLIAELDRAAAAADILCVSDQFSCGCVTEAVRAEINSLAAQGLPVVVDSRYRIGQFRGCILKPNEFEGLTALGREAGGSRPELAELAAAACELARRTAAKVCLTLGDRGCLVTAADESPTHLPAAPAEPPLDICGAGDTFLAALACSLATGADLTAAAVVASLASGVTVRKIGQTGTASREEILAAGRQIREA